MFWFADQYWPQPSLETLNLTLKKSEVDSASKSEKGRIRDK